MFHFSFSRLKSKNVTRHLGILEYQTRNVNIYIDLKKALMRYVHLTVLGPIRDTNIAIFESTKDPIRQLHAFVDSAFGIHKDVSLYFRFVQQKRTVANQIDERFDLVMRPLIKLLSQGIQSGDFIDVDPRVLAEMVYGTVIGSLISIQSGWDGSQDMKKIKQDILCLVDKIILRNRRNK